MAWVVTPAMQSHRNAFNQRFPNRRKLSDGFIGDDAHKLKPSSHNPDDTPGSKSEYTDADTKQEVRAADTDENLNDPQVNMFDVVASIIDTPDDVKRCKYLILHDTVWSRNTDWESRPYSGDYHNHLHCSGDPLFDEDGSEWKSITQLGGGMASNPPNWNDAQKARSVFDMMQITKLDTDGSVDGSGNLQNFPTPIVVYVLALNSRLTAAEAGLVTATKRIAAIEAYLADLPDPGLPAGMTQAQFDDMYKNALARTTLTEEQL